MPSLEENQPDPVRAAISRRGLFAGAGAAAIATSLIGMPEAEARSPQARSDVAAAGVHPDGAPVTTSIASPPISGYVYRVACMYDFQPFDPASQRTWGGEGVYTAGVAGPLRTSFEIPAGAIVRDIEWYVRNAGATDVAGDLYQYAAGVGVITTLNVTTTIAPNSNITAVRMAVPASTAGPFPSGSRLLASVTTPTDASVQVNGVRLGFSQGQGQTALLTTPVRAYDSRSTGGALGSGSTRTITLPAAAFPAGAVGALINVTAVGATGSGYLKVYPANSSAPSASALNYGTASIANAITVGVSSARQIKIFASRTVNVIVDVTGYVA